MQWDALATLDTSTGLNIDDLNINDAGTYYFRAEFVKNSTKSNCSNTVSHTVELNTLTSFLFPEDETTLYSLSNSIDAKITGSFVPNSTVKVYSDSDCSVVVDTDSIGSSETSQKNLSLNLSVADGGSIDLFAEVITTGGRSSGCTAVGDKLVFTKLSDASPSLTATSGTSGDLNFLFSSLTSYPSSSYSAELFLDNNTCTGISTASSVC